MSISSIKIHLPKHNKINTMHAYFTLPLLMLPLKTLFKQGRSVTKTNYRSYLKLFAWIVISTCFIVLSNTILQSQQKTMLSTQETYVKQNISIGPGSIVDPNDTAAKEKIQQETQILSTEFYKKSENIPTYLLMITLFIIIIIIQYSIKLGIIHTSRILSTTPPMSVYTWGDFFKPIKKIVPIAITDIIKNIFIFLGIIFFIIPGIYIAIRLSFTDFSLVIGNTTSWGAIKHSRNITNGKTLYLLKIYVFFALMQIIGALLLIVGLLGTIPLMRTMQAMIYRQLNESHT